MTTEDEVLAWGKVNGGGNRYHALVELGTYDVAACGQLVDGIVFDNEPDWKAEVPYPPQMCPKCRRALNH